MLLLSMPFSPHADDAHITPYYMLPLDTLPRAFMLPPAYASRHAATLMPHAALDYAMPMSPPSLII